MDNGKLHTRIEPDGWWEGVEKQEGLDVSAKKEISISDGQQVCAENLRRHFFLNRACRGNVNYSSSSVGNFQCSKIKHAYSIITCCILYLIMKLTWDIPIFDFLICFW